LWWWRGFGGGFRVLISGERHFCGVAGKLKSSAPFSPRVSFTTDNDQIQSSNQTSLRSSPDNKKPAKK
jgi:hypothetical protein